MSLPAGVEILSSEPDNQIAALFASLRVQSGQDAPLLHSLRQALFRRKLPYGPTHLTAFARGLQNSTFLWYHGLAALTAMDEFAESAPLPEETKAELRTARAMLDDRSGAKRAQYERRMDALIGDGSSHAIRAGDAWTDAALVELEQAPQEVVSRWEQVLQHAVKASSGKPSAKWMATSARLIALLPSGDFGDRLKRWLSIAERPTEAENAHRSSGRLMSDTNADVLRGLLWMVAEVDDPELARAIGRLATSAFKKLPGIGPRAVKIGNACIYALGQMPSPEALGQLAYLRVKIKFGAAQKELTKALNAAATRLGVPADEIDEMGVPSYGLAEVGASSEPIGDFTAELRVNESNRCEITWRKPDGKLQKSVPAAIKSNFADDLKDLKARAKDVEKMLPAQRDRIDSLFLARKSWPITVWRERYLDHPLVGTIARRIIWRFSNGEQSSDGMWLGDRIVNVDAEPLEWIDDPETRVELWHPIGLPMDDVLSWRGFLERHEIRQPFKQAHREVYPLTDAERRTGTYSNRFAAHVLRQHQFHALCAVRGWKDQLRLMVDATVPPPTKRLPQWGLRAEFWVEGAGDQPGTDTTDTGTFLYLTTDQVRFYAIDAPQREVHVMGGGYFAGREQRDEPLPLNSIPPLALSEILRDVDLFVGVASVGNDPAWSDGGPAGRYREYWAQFSFGDLTAAGEVRRDVLSRLIPRLKIAPRCTLDEKYLVVRGDLRSYKIHLGSGNILMTPNDQYLCIVPKSSEWAPGQVFLPFEGDRTLSIILSKAMLLAEDTKISDPTIVSQIKR
jgi:hypothetical protein